MTGPIGSGRVAGGLHPHTSFPQPKVAQDALDDVGLVHEGDDPHLMLAMGAQERVGFPDFLDEFAPLLGRDPAELERGHIDDLALGRGHGFGVRLFEAQATHLVGVPAVVADELEAFVRDVLGDAGDEVARAEHFKIAGSSGSSPSGK